MLSPSTFRKLVSGQQTGLFAGAARCLLRLAEIPYGWAMRLRNGRYDRGRAEVHRVEVPVISVGNLTLGGTGKTPLVEWIARHQRQQGLRVALVSRGYAAADDGKNDEALELQLALPDVPHLQNRDRVAAARAVVEQHDAQVIILDDGFQHRRLARDLDIVLLDATEPFGYEHVFPRGTLREPLAGLKRADVVILSRADMLDEASRHKVQQRVQQWAPEALWCEVVHGPSKLINANSESQPLTSLAGQRVAAFCGIGNPAGFRHTLSTLGGELFVWQEFPDHYRYTPENIQSLANWSEGADVVLCTRKDLVKLSTVSFGNTPLWALSIELQFLTGEEAFESLLTGCEVPCSRSS